MFFYKMLKNPQSDHLLVLISLFIYTYTIMVLFHKPELFEPRYLDPKAHRRKCCTCMSLRGGCAVACAIWLVKYTQED